MIGEKQYFTVVLIGLYLMNEVEHFFHMVKSFTFLLFYKLCVSTPFFYKVISMFLVYF